jgi:hypothetical protein
LRLENLVAGAGFEPKEAVSAEVTDSAQNPPKPEHFHALPDSPSPGPEQKPAPPEGRSSHFHALPGCTQVVPKTTLPADLAQVVEAWGRLPEAIRAGILAMVKAAK